MHITWASEATCSPSYNYYLNHFLDTQKNLPRANTALSPPLGPPQTYYYFTPPINQQIISVTEFAIQVLNITNNLYEGKSVI